MKWWSSIQDSVVDPGNPLSNGQNVTVDGAVTEITAEMDPPLGYMIVEAASMDDALDLLTDSPMGMRVYEAICRRTRPEPPVHNGTYARLI